MLSALNDRRWAWSVSPWRRWSVLLQFAPGEAAALRTDPLLAEVNVNTRFGQHAVNIEIIPAGPICLA